MTVLGKLAICAVAALSMTACVTAETAMLDERTAIISGRGDEYSSAARVQQRVLLEAAESATERGFRYFLVMSAQDTTRRGIAQMPITTTGQGQATTTCSYGTCRTNAQGNAMTMGGGAYEFTMPGADVQVRFYREGEIDPATPGLWDAQSILAAQPRK